MADETDTTTTTSQNDTTTDASQDAAPAVEQATEAAETTDTEATEQPADGSLLGSAGDKKDDADAPDKADAEAADGEEAAPEGAPEEYDLKVTDEEGNELPLDPEILATSSETMREMNLTNEQANKLAPLAQDIMTKGHAAAVAQITEAGNQQKAEWGKEVENDPDLGGKNLQATLDTAAVGLDALGYTKDSEFRQLLDESGFGNNIHMVRIMHTIGKLASEGTDFARSDAAGDEEVVGWSDRYKD